MEKVAVVWFSSSAPVSRGDCLVLRSDDEVVRARVEAIKKEWKLLWSGRIEDKVRAEGIAKESFSLLSVERGTVIVASRNVAPLDLREVLRAQRVQNVDAVLGPRPSVGGWRKFAKSTLNKQSRVRKHVYEDVKGGCRCKGLPAKQGGRGWLHRC